METAANKGLGLGSAEPYSGVGAELKSLREEQGHSLPDAATALRINSRYLVALEEGAFQELPGPAYVLGFLRSYASFLGVSPVLAVQKFKSESRYQHKPELDFPVPVRETNIPRFSLVWGSLALGVIVLSGWYFIQEAGKVDFDEIATVPEDWSEPAERGPIASDREGVTEVSGGGVTDEVAGGGVTDEVAGGVETIAVVDTEFELESIEKVKPEEIRGDVIEAESEHPEPDTSVSSELMEPLTSDDIEGDEVRPNIVPTPPPPPVERQSGQEPRIYGAENSMSRVTLLAAQDSWVQVEGPERQLLITRILYAGDSYRVPDLSGLTLITGNAGGLKIIVDNVEVPPLGPLGAVRRGVLLEPESLLASGSSGLD
ncbi:MAG: RodZ domain-containing protein [Pseudomonadota bacterium]|nr:RodZ domain-containing protein [Pseudomonadota bacterium]